MVPHMFFKKLFDSENLQMYCKELQTEFDNGAPPTSKTLVATIRKMVMDRIQNRARLIQILERSEKCNQMGDQGKNILTFMGK